MPIRVSALRALGGYANIFAIESFMDSWRRSPRWIRSSSLAPSR